MAKQTDTRCKVCGAIIGPGLRYCSHFCKLSDRKKKPSPGKKTKTKNDKD